MTIEKNVKLIRRIAIPSVIVLFLFVIIFQRILPAYANKSSSQVTIMASELNVRDAADSSSNIIGLVHRGDTFEIIQTNNNWDQIKLLDNRIGWINHTYVASTKNIDATVEAPVLNVREQPSLSSKVVGKLKLGSKIEIYLEQAGWAQIVSNSGIHGWVYADYITKDTNNPQQIPSAGTTPPAAMTTTENKAVTNQVFQATGPFDSSVGGTNAPSTNTGLKQHSQDSLKGKTIVLDPGHGGKDDGTTSITGIHEKDLTLATVQAVEQKLKNAGAHVILTRADDTFISLQQRADLSNKSHADVFISFHYNWSSDPNIHGLTDFYYNQKKDSSLASTILNEVVKTTGLNNQGTNFNDLYVLRNNTQPSVLIELGFVSNKQDELAVASPSYNNDVAQGVYSGLLDYFTAPS